MNIRLQKQLNLRAADNFMEYREVEKLELNYVNIPNSSEGKKRFSSFDGSVHWGQLLLVRILT